MTTCKTTFCKLTLIANNTKTMTSSENLKNAIAEHQAMFAKLGDLIPQISQVAEELKACIKRGGKILLMGGNSSESSPGVRSGSQNMAMMGAEADDFGDDYLEKGELGLSLNLLAEMALQVGELPLAMASATEALTIFNDTRGLPPWWRSSVLLTLGNISSAQGRLSAAEKYLNTALKERRLYLSEGPQTIRVLIALASAYQREGMNSSAIITYREIFGLLKKLNLASSDSISKEDLIPLGLAVVAYAKTLTDPAAGKIVAADVEGQTIQVLANIRALLDSQGLPMSAVIKATVFLQNMADFPKVNSLYEAAFAGHKPARSTVAVAGLPLGALVEIEVIAELN